MATKKQLQEVEDRATNLSNQLASSRKANHSLAQQLNKEKESHKQSLQELVDIQKTVIKLLTDLDDDLAEAAAQTIGK